MLETEEGIFMKKNKTKQNRNNTPKEQKGVRKVNAWVFRRAVSTEINAS